MVQCDVLNAVAASGESNTKLSTSVVSVAPPTESTDSSGLVGGCNVSLSALSNDGEELRISGVRLSQPIEDGPLDGDSTPLDVSDLTSTARGSPAMPGLFATYTLLH